jgi:uncharacterized Zn-binding protein involved in type VI secretion
MADSKVARLDTGTSHGKSKMITASKVVFGDDLGMCGVGDLVSPHRVGKRRHPPNPVVTGSSVTFLDGDRPLARVGDKLKCGAVLVGKETVSNVFSD